MALLMVPGFLEAIFIFCVLLSALTVNNPTIVDSPNPYTDRRFMIQVIVDHRVMIIAITLTGFEEALLRTTMQVDPQYTT